MTRAQKRQAFQSFLQFLSGVVAGLIAIGGFPTPEQAYLVTLGGAANALLVWGASKAPVGDSR